MPTRRVVRAAKSRGLLAIPGFFTPAEAFSLLAAGADALKLFPAEAGSPAMLRALRAVLPQGTMLLPVGGVDAGNIPAWRARRRRRLRHRLGHLQAGRHARQVRAKARAAGRGRLMSGVADQICARLVSRDADASRRYFRLRHRRRRRRRLGARQPADRAAGTTVCVLEAGPPDRNPWIHIPAGFTKTLFDPSCTWQFKTEPTATHRRPRASPPRRAARSAAPAASTA